MKKVLAIALVGIIAATSAITFAACSSSKDAKESTAATAATQKATEAVAPTKVSVSIPSDTTLTEAAETQENDETVYQDDNTADVYETEAGEMSNYRSNSDVYQALYHTIRDSDANGYAICSIYGIDGQVLLLSHGEIEAERYYDVYQILDSDVEYIGQLAGAHNVAYIGSDGMLGLYSAYQGYFTYGPVLYDGSLSESCINEGTVSGSESYPDIPGAEVNFFAATDFSGIAQF